MNTKQIKQILCIIVSATCITGCSSEGESISVSEGTSVSIETETPQTEEPVSDVIVVERNIDVDSVQSFLFDGGSYTMGVNAFGVDENNDNLSGNNYRKDVIIAMKDGWFGIYDFDGYTLLNCEYYLIDQVAGVFVVWTDDSSSYILNEDFMTLGEESGFGGAFIPFTIMDGVVSQADQNINAPVSEALYGEVFENMPELLLVNSTDASGNVQGSGIIDEYGNIICDISGWYSSNMSTLSDGYVFLSNTESSYDYETGTYTHGELMLFNEDGEEILNETVEDAGYMWNGYAPVKKDGRWGYISEEGEYVIDCIFDDASSLNDGKAYAKYNGEWIILNIAESLNNGVVNAEAIDTALQKFDEERNSSSIGMITVNVDGLNIRKEADSSSDKLGKVIQGNTYHVYETVNDTDYTWYRIGEEKWIADDGTWCTYQVN